MNNALHILQINGLELYVHLGWPDEERAEKQLVHVNIQLHFAQSPLACKNDQLTDTLCYATFIDQIIRHITPKTFHLIERLADEIYLFSKSVLPPNTGITVEIIKYPKIQGLSGTISFHYGDDLQK